MEHPFEPVGDCRRTGIIKGQHRAEKRDFSRHLRRNMTVAEALLWEQIRAGRLDGLRFRRQQIIDGFIVDFFCYSLGLIVEVDGSIHEQQQQEDEEREEAFAKRRLQILRFTNEEVKCQMSDTLHQIRQVAQNT